MIKLGLKDRPRVETEASHGLVRGGWLFRGILISARSLALIEKKIQKRLNCMADFLCFLVRVFYRNEARG
jgi:hypothetical protein